MTHGHRDHQAAGDRGPPPSRCRAPSSCSASIDILVFGLFSHAGDASFELSTSGSGVQIPAIQVPAALVCYVVGAISVVLGIWRGTVEPGKPAKRVAIGAVLVCFLIALLCWADAGDSTAVNLINLMQQSFAPVHSARARRALPAACASDPA